MKFAIIIAALGAGCVGEIGAQVDGEPATEGQRMYSSTVSPLLRSACAGCHEAAGSGPAFLGLGGDSDDYTALRSNARIVGGFESANALLLTKGAHSGSTWWSAQQQSTIESWLELEATSGTVSDGGDVMAAWASCMTLENWDDSRMGEWANKRTEDGNTCGGCHADGEYGFHANPASDIMFAQQRTQRGIGTFFQVSAATATPSVAPSIDKLRNKCAGGNLHPGCAVDDQYVEYLERFHKLTRAMLDAGLCDEPGYKTLTDPL